MTPELADMTDGNLVSAFAYATGEVVEERGRRGAAAYEELVNEARLLRDELLRRLAAARECCR